MQGQNMINVRRRFAQDGCLRIMGLSVPVYDRWSKIAVSIIGLTWVTLPLIPFIGNIGLTLVTAPLIPFSANETSQFANWLGSLYLASPLLANLILACFARRIAFEHRSHQLENLFESSGARHPSDLDDTLVDSTGAERAKRKGLRISDLMFLIAETAIAIVLVTTFLSDMQTVPRSRDWFWGLWAPFVGSLLVLIAFTLGFSVCWIGRLRQPFRVFSQSPGAVACLLALAVLLTAAYHLGVNYATQTVRRDMQFVLWRLEYWCGVISVPPVAIGFLIVSVWNLLILSGRWKAEPTWIDRYGRLLGVCWIGWAAIYTIVLPVVAFVEYFCI
jgi:hypothetical protein